MQTTVRLISHAVLYINKQTQWEQVYVLALNRSLETVALKAMTRPGDKSLFFCGDGTVLTFEYVII